MRERIAIGWRWYGTKARMDLYQVSPIFFWSYKPFTPPWSYKSDRHWSVAEAQPEADVFCVCQVPVWASYLGIGNPTIPSNRNCWHRQGLETRMTEGSYPFSIRFLVLKQTPSFLSSFGPKEWGNYGVISLLSHYSFPNRCWGIGKVIEMDCGVI